MQSLKKYESGAIAVYDFMVGGLGLSGNELLVFAAIYSFGKGTEGEFFGTRTYLSKRIGGSVRSITRSISMLMEKGLLIKSEGRFKELNNAVYRVNVDEVERRILEGRICKGGEARQNNAADSNRGAGQSCRSIGQNGTITPPSEEGQNGVTPVTNCHYPRDKMSLPPGQNGTIDNKDDNKEDNKDELTDCLSVKKRTREEFEDEVERSVSEFWGKCDDLDLTEELEGKRYKVIGIGRDRIVPMTDKQYTSLLRLAPAEVIDGYINKINGYTSYPASGMVKNPYKTIQKWLKEDFEA